MQRSAVLFLLIIFCGTGLAVSQPAGTGQVSGEIEISAGQSQVNVRSRGSVYRSRYQNKKTPGTVISADPMQDVVVYLTPLDFTPSVAPLTPFPRLIQKDVTFNPRVLAITTGTSVLIVNEDRIYHNVFSKSQVQSFNIGKRITGENVYQVFNKPGLIQVFCNIHSNMSSHILVLNTPYFSKPDDDGKFNFKDLPDGRYLVEVFHPDHSVEPLKITVKSGSINKIKLTLR